MNKLIEKIKKYIAEKKQDQDDAQFQIGFGMCMVAFYIHHESVEEMEAYIVDDHINNPYDRGWRYAIQILSNVGGDCEAQKNEIAVLKATMSAAEKDLLRIMDGLEGARNITFDADCIKQRVK